MKTYAEPISGSYKRPNDYECDAYAFANDAWSPETVKALVERLNAQQTAAEKRAAVVIGAGGLPYLLPHLRASVVHVVDLSEEVPVLTSDRVAALGEHSSWPAYHEAVEASLAPRDVSFYYEERRYVRKSGLEGDFRATRAAAAVTALRLHAGDFLHLAVSIGRDVAAEGQEVAFANMTNISTWVGTPKEAGKLRVYNALRDLPLASDVVIVDSSQIDNWSCDPQPRLYTLEEYAEAAHQALPRER